MRFETELAKSNVDVNYYNHMVGHGLDIVQKEYIHIDPESVRTIYKHVENKLSKYQKISYN